MLALDGNPVEPTFQGQPDHVHRVARHRVCKDVARSVLKPDAGRRQPPCSGLLDSSCHRPEGTDQGSDTGEGPACR